MRPADEGKREYIERAEAKEEPSPVDAFEALVFDSEERVAASVFEHDLGELSYYAGSILKAQAMMAELQGHIAFMHGEMAVATTDRAYARLIVKRSGSSALERYDRLAHNLGLHLIQPYERRASPMQSIWTPPGEIHTTPSETIKGS